MLAPAQTGSTFASKLNSFGSHKCTDVKIYKKAVAREVTRRFGTKPFRSLDVSAPDISALDVSAPNKPRRFGARLA